jgi:Domain of unknown function (DUF4190)
VTQGSETITDTATLSGGRRIPMAKIDLPWVMLIAFGGAVLGSVVGVLTGNLFFVYIAAGLSLASVFFAGAFTPTQPMTKPAGGESLFPLPVVALVLSVVGAAPAGIIVGHLSRRSIRERGGSGDGVALAALIVGYAILALWVAAGLWALTYLQAIVT